MRDPDRIQEILDLLLQLWGKDKDLRFFQMIHILQHSYSHKNNDLGKIEEVEKDGYSRVAFDLFNVEDEEVIKLLKEKLSST
jgi:hypothetical protein